MSFKTKEPVLNYLDDFFFTAMLRMLCNGQVNTFLEVCQTIKFPVSLEKTYWGTKLLIFLGLLLDSEYQIVRIPREKIMKARTLISLFLEKGRKKVTVLQIQQLTGFLNFLGKCVVPGRVFTRHLYTYVYSKMLPHHHVHVTSEMREDLKVWMTFLEYPLVFNRPFMEFGAVTAEDIELFSDASGSSEKGMGAICQMSWMYKKWDKQFFNKNKPSIEYLELYGVAAAVLTWIHRFQNRKIYLFCDNISVVHMSHFAYACKMEFPA